MRLPLSSHLARAWGDIQWHHPELPDLSAPESLIRNSPSACGKKLSFERLLHEAVHGIASARGVRDTCRVGRYHNRRFLLIADGLGLHHPEKPDPVVGFSRLTLTREATLRYHSAMERLHVALDSYEVTESANEEYRPGPPSRSGPAKGGGRVKAVCDCGRNIRVTLSALAQAPIVCGGCGMSFRAQ